MASKKVGPTSIHALDITPQLEVLGVSAALVKDQLVASATQGAMQVKVLDLVDDRAGAVVGKQDVALRVVQGRVFISFPPPGGSSGLDESLWGAAPTNIDIQEASMQSKDRAFAARREVLDNSVSRSKAAQWLGVSEPTVSDRIADRTLVAIKDGREWRLPMWQFDPDTERGFFAGLDRLQEVYPGNAISLSMWVLTDHPDLDGPPIAALSEHRVDEVLEAAKILRATT